MSVYISRPFHTTLVRICWLVMGDSYRVGEDDRVWNEDISALFCGHYRRSCLDIGYIPLNTSHADTVSQLERLLQQQENSRQEVL